MLQTFDVMTRPEDGPPRLARLRDEMAKAGIDAFLVPRADAHRGENVAPSDERLRWLTGFTGSAGFVAVTASKAALFVDGRYTLQAAAQVSDVFERKNIPGDKLADWLNGVLGEGAKVGFDPWLHTSGEIEGLGKALKGPAPVPVSNLLDLVWTDRPSPPTAALRTHPDQLAGRSSLEKRQDIAATLRKEDVAAAILTLPDSIAWLLNVRGSDIERTPVPLAFAVLHADARVDLALEDPAQARDVTLDEAIRVIRKDSFVEALGQLDGRVAVDRDTAPAAVAEALGAEVVWRRDPVVLPKACKSEAELTGARAAQRRDATAMIRFLAWLDDARDLTEIDVVEALEGFRHDTGALQDISFETISGAGPNGAIVHYRVNRDTNRALEQGSLLLVDSGGQYEDGTTDITRTIAIGDPPADAVRAFTLVLRGMISLSDMRWPAGLAGRDIDAIARHALWQAGFDYDHGTGHGVGSFLDVHEGPASISRRSNEPLRPGMILSNEPGYYREGAFGIRIENLVAVNPPDIPEGGDREMLSFETLTYVPIDRRLIDPDLLGAEARAWLNAYHARVWDLQADLVDGPSRAWLKAATQTV